MISKKKLAVKISILESKILSLPRSYEVVRLGTFNEMMREIRAMNQKIAVLEESLSAVVNTLDAHNIKPACETCGQVIDGDGECW